MMATEAVETAPATKSLPSIKITTLMHPKELPFPIQGQNRNQHHIHAVDRALMSTREYPSVRSNL